MRTDKIRKYLIPNIPYLFILWAFLKLGTAYRLAAGNDFAHKLIGLGQMIGPAFADFAPGLAPLDWLIGIVGAVGFRLLIYFKSKNAKKFRRDAEYGSARWGTEKDIKPFVDPRFENNVILTGTEFLTMNTRPKIPANARNLNCCIIGSSGSGKTRFWLTPQLLQAHSSYVVVDPKGGVLGQVGAFLQKRGYKIKVFNSIDFSKSMHYNPLAYIRNEADILKFVDALISNTKGEGKEGDPFWTKSETLLYCALIAYIIFEGPAEDRNMNTMTGFGRGTAVLNGREITVELRSVNSRYFEYSSRIPRTCSSLDSRLKKQLNQRISRGKVELSMTVQNVDAADTVVAVNMELARSYQQAMRDLSEQLGVKNDVSTAVLTRFPDVLTTRHADVDEEQLWQDVSAVTAQALDRFVEMRAAEGAKMKADVESRLV